MATTKAVSPNIKKTRRLAGFFVPAWYIAHMRSFLLIIVLSLLCGCSGMKVSTQQESDLDTLRTGARACMPGELVCGQGSVIMCCQPNQQCDANTGACI